MAVARQWSDAFALLDEMTVIGGAYCTLELESFVHALLRQDILRKAGAVANPTALQGWADLQHALQYI